MRRCLVSEYLFRGRALQITLLFCGVILTHGCRKEDQAATRTVPVPAVRTTPVVQGEVTDYSYFTGRTDAQQSVDIQSRVTGYLLSIDFEPGAEVKTNQQLFKIDPRPYQAALDEATGQVNLSKAQLQLAEANYLRALEVAKTPGAISQQDLDRYAASKAEAQASVSAAEANGESAKLNLEFTSIISPIDGVVSRNLLTIGNLVKQDTTLLTTVVSLDPIYVYFDVDDHTLLKVLRLIQEGKITSYEKGTLIPVEIGLADEGDRYPHQGRVDFINTFLDPTSGTLQLRGTFENPPIRENGPRLLKPGLFVRVRLPLGQPYQALLVPQAAIGTDQGLKFVLVVNDEGVVEYRPVQVGPQQQDGMQVVIPVKMSKKGGGPAAVADSPTDAGLVDSLTASDQVIIGGIQRVRPGVKVTTTSVPTSQAVKQINATVPQLPAPPPQSGKSNN